MPMRTVVEMCFTIVLAVQDEAFFEPSTTHKIRGRSKHGGYPFTRPILNLAYGGHAWIVPSVYFSVHHQDFVISGHGE
jgi:hypothetical protein